MVPFIQNSIIEINFGVDESLVTTISFYYNQQMFHQKKARLLYL